MNDIGFWFLFGSYVILFVVHLLTQWRLNKALEGWALAIQGWAQSDTMLEHYLAKGRHDGHHPQ